MSAKRISDGGLTYRVRYVGCTEINTSMRSLSYETRLQVAVECIRRVCEAAKAPSVTSERVKRVNSPVSQLVGDTPNLEYSKSLAELRITSSEVCLKALPSQEVIAEHEMPCISFASGGDAETAEYVAYIAKGKGRVCYVLECGNSLAIEVINALGNAFQLRYEQVCQQQQDVNNENITEEAEYYNDMPGKVPPDLSVISKKKAPGGGDLIDFNETQQRRYRNNDLQSKDPFDMQPFLAPAADPPRVALQKETWYFGSICRADAERFVAQDGEFLVRESQGLPGQFILTGMNSGVRKHLLLVDPEGVIRTKDRTFESVKHLVEFHCDNSLPIVSADSEVYLRRPAEK